MFEDASNFYRSGSVERRDVSLKDQFGMTVAGHLFRPGGRDGSAELPAIVVGHPMGAVKEQSADLYATKMAEAGFAALSIDLPFWGESEGRTRNLVSPDHYAEAFSAGVDFLGSQPDVDAERIGAIGICGRPPDGDLAAPGKRVSITISGNGRQIVGTLEATTAAREFVGMLPMELTLSYNGTEKIGDLPKPLSLDGAPAGIAPKAGDIAYYAPWGNPAIFHREFRYSPSILRLGRIESNTEMLSRSAIISVRIARLRQLVC